MTLNIFQYTNQCAKLGARRIIGGKSPVSNPSPTGWKGTTVFARSRDGAPVEKSFTVTPKAGKSEMSKTIANAVSSILGGTAEVNDPSLAFFAIMLIDSLIEDQRRTAAGWIIQEFFGGKEFEESTDNGQIARLLNSYAVRRKGDKEYVSLNATPELVQRMRDNYQESLEIAMALTGGTTESEGQPKTKETPDIAAALAAATVEDSEDDESESEDDSKGESGEKKTRPGRPPKIDSSKKGEKKESDDGEKPESEEKQDSK